MASIFPKNYKSLLDPQRTERAIKFVKDTFERELSGELKLSRVTSPLFVKKGSGINDDLNGVERPVGFEVGNMNNCQMEIVQSLAKWKRMALADYEFEPETGLYTDMNAIRPDDLIDNIHSIYVDQWDWERVMSEEERNLDFLKRMVSKIYEALKRTEFLIGQNYPECISVLPKELTFIQSEDALKMYPDVDSVERERRLAERYGAIFIIGVGKELSDGESHGGRSPDYDDWSTETEEYIGEDGKKHSYYGLNGDLIVWDTVRQDSLELSSMGIRVDGETLLKQLEMRNFMERKELYWHQRLLNGDFPQTIGGGIGQSRLCMFLLHKAHIGEVQASIWTEEDLKEAKTNNVFLM